GSASMWWRTCGCDSYLLLTAKGLSMTYRHVPFDDLRATLAVVLSKATSWCSTANRVVICIRPPSATNPLQISRIASVPVATTRGRRTTPRGYGAGEPTLAVGAGTFATSA